MSQNKFNPFRVALGMLDHPGQPKGSHTLQYQYICHALEAVGRLCSDKEELCTLAQQMVMREIWPQASFSAWLHKHVPQVATALSCVDVDEYPHDMIQDYRRQYLVHKADLYDQGKLILSLKHNNALFPQPIVYPKWVEYRP